MDYNNENDDIDLKNSSKSLVDKKKSEDFYSMNSNVWDNSSLEPRNNNFISSNFQNKMNNSDISDINEKDRYNNSSILFLFAYTFLIQLSFAFLKNSLIESLYFLIVEE